MNITWHKVCKFIPVPVFWTDKWLKEWQGGVSYGFFCIIRPKYLEKDKGILLHELEHCRQFYSHFPIYGLLYRMWQKHRLNFEVQAYAIQLASYGTTKEQAEWVVRALVKNYNLTLSEVEIRSSLHKACKY